jgi:hypothetical protein
MNLPAPARGRGRDGGASLRSVAVALAALLAEALLDEEDVRLFLVARALRLRLLLVQLLEHGPLDLPQRDVLLLVQVLRAGESRRWGATRGGARTISPRRTTFSPRMRYSPRQFSANTS